jgi:hypothetical protein
MKTTIQTNANVHVIVPDTSINIFEPTMRLRWVVRCVPIGDNGIGSDQKILQQLWIDRYNGGKEEWRDIETISSE